MPDTRVDDRRVGAAAGYGSTPRIDQVLARSAAAHPDRVAIRVGERTTTYAELDAAVTRCAALIGELTGGQPTVVAVSSILAVDYVIAYYGAIRSGNVVLPVNPLLDEPALTHVFATSRAQVAFLTAPVCQRVGRIASQLPERPRIVVFGADQPFIGTGTDTGSSAGGGVDLGRDRGHPLDDQSDQVAALHFTSGTTGAPRAVRLSHRNVTTNAAQVAAAHLLDTDAVSLVCFPTYHPMHLNAAVYAAATQVLSADPDLTGAIELANRHRATHLYSIPAWLIRLANQPNPHGLRLQTVRFVASGGAALPPAVAATLAERLGVPVIQGYGLAETSPLTHFDPPDAPTPGSVGKPLTDTECRIVEVDSRREVPAGEFGEVQVRGPQLMLGYLDDPESTDVDADGWLSTGDIGYLDADDRLFLVDRLKDVFKHDNWLVSPTEIEAVLAGHPAVRDCAVVDRPDEVHGAVAHAYLVLDPRPERQPRPEPETGAAAEADQHRLADIVDWVNARLPPYKRIGHAEVVPAVPRTPNGKVPRRQLRAALHAELTGGSTVVILVNKFTLTASPERFEEVFSSSSEFMRDQPGFISHTLVRSLRSPNVYVNIAYWQDAASHMKAVQSPQFQAHITDLADVARAEPDVYTVVQDVERAAH